MKKTKEALKGGEFLIKETDFNDIFIPEQWNEEQKMISKMCEDFLDTEVLNKLEEIDTDKNGTIMPSLIEKAGEMGLLGVSTPEEYGGFDKDFTTSMITTEVMGRGHSFAVAMSAHTGIGTLPILYYGNKEQKDKYIPKLTTGEWKASYCLTEPNSGSDANSGKTKAVINDSGDYVINGQKMWITNAGFADVFVVFAKVEDDKNLTAFIVEKTFEGLSLNPEEQKMGIKGSSTRQVFLNNVVVPKENLLGVRNEGFKIALNILNIGRIKLGGATLGGAKSAMELSIKYAKEREQFGTSISNFGAIKQKIAEQYIKTLSVESAIYRTSNDIDNYMSELISNGVSKEDATLKACEEYSIEAAIIKITGSEMLDYVVDEAVQIHGGMGFSSESQVERCYRDSRINRIFEGTNEINRMLIVDMLVKKAMSGKVDFVTPAKDVANEILDINFSLPSDVLFENESKYVSNFKKCALLVTGVAVKLLKTKMKSEQEVMMGISDIISLSYLSESLLLRVQKLVNNGDIKEDSIEVEALKVFLFDTSYKINKIALDTLISFVETGDELNIMLSGVKRFTKVSTFNVKNSRRKIADKLYNQ